MTTYDIIWIGTGQATGTVVPRLVKAGKKVALIEGGRFGGSCVNDGCTPTKTIIASARAAHMARRGPDFGVSTGTIGIDFARVMERANEMRHGSSAGMEKWLRGLEGVTVYEGYGRFTTFPTWPWLMPSPQPGRLSEKFKQRDLDSDKRG